MANGINPAFKNVNKSRLLKDRAEVWPDFKVPYYKNSMASVLKVLSYNIHKGFSIGGSKFVLHEIRQMLRDTGVDLVFLQEVLGENQHHAQKIGAWPTVSQYEFLADSVWQDHRYGQNAIYDGGHHGNAILSRFPISGWENLNISTNKRENRGILHTTIPIPGSSLIHACCTHLDLTHRGRINQLRQLTQWLDKKIPSSAPLILAGDFNDWSKKASHILNEELGLVEVIETSHGRLLATFPALLPILSLDRIYVRGLKIVEAKILREKIWRKLSDHVPVQATLQIDTQLFDT